MQTQIKNQVKLGIFCALIGATAGIVIWVFLKVMSLGISFLWEWIPARIHLPCYPLLLCLAGALLLGILHRCLGDYPEELETVFRRLKEEKTYGDKNMLVLLVLAMIPLIMGSSVGPEAGLTGVVVGLCCWAGKNIKAAYQDAEDYTQVGIVVTLGVLFHAPLFGVFTVEEGEQSELTALAKPVKLLLYGLALGAGTGAYLLLTSWFGSGMEGIPSFAESDFTTADIPMFFVYLLCGCLLALFYELTHRASKCLLGLPLICREVVGGLVLGTAGMLAPALLFSGEEQMGVLMQEYGTYLPWMLVAVAFLKVLLTNVCIQSGLKGGHFFPVIFAGTALGYGVALLILGSGGHVVFAAAMVTATVLGGMMHKPLAVTMLLFLCFPVRMFLWIFLAAAIGDRVLKWMLPAKQKQTVE